jgi:DNA-binding transcriptional LysR family regulator
VATPPVRLAALDLNLLVVFDAVMRERSVTRAGKSLGLSQPAMSHALARLRHMLRDDLFIRGPRGMAPTPRAEELAVPVRQALDGLQQSLEPTQFDPAEARRTFRVAVDNYAALVLVAELAARIGATAPGMTAEFRPSGTLDIVDRLDNGDLDLAIGVFSPLGARFSHQPLLEDGFVAVTRSDHPEGTGESLSAEQFAATPRLELSSVHVATDFVDQALARRNLERPVVLHVPFVSAAGILAATDMVAVFPRRMAEELVRSRPLRIRQLAFTSATFEIAMIWPRRLDNQATHRWLRDMVGRVCHSLPRVTEPA